MILNKVCALVLSGLVISIVTACTKTESEPGQKTTVGIETQAQTGATLLLVEPSNGACQFSFNFIDGNKIEPWFFLPECLSAQDELVFDTNKSRAFVLQKGKYWQVGLHKEAKPEFFADAYIVPPTMQVAETKTWIDKTSGNFRAAYLVIEPYDQNSQAGSDWVHKNFPMLTKRQEEFVFEGVTAVAMVVELGVDGKWKILATELTATDAGESPGLAVVSSYSQNAETFSLWDLLMQATCGGQHGCFTELTTFPSNVADWIKAQYKPDEESGDGVSYIAIGDSDGILAGVSFGDSAHWSMPLYYCRGNAKNLCEQHDEIVFEESQLGIAVKSRYVLVTKEYYGTSAKLLKSGSAIPLLNFKPETVVVWMPMAPW